MNRSLLAGTARHDRRTLNASKGRCGRSMACPPGCVGILKDWLVRVLVSISRRSAETLKRKDLEAHAPSVAQCDKMLSEAVEGEVRLIESAEERSRLRTRLGLSEKENSSEMTDSPTKIAAQARNPLKPGQRRPVRDAVGPASSMEANGSCL